MNQFDTTKQPNMFWVKASTLSQRKDQRKPIRGKAQEADQHPKQHANLARQKGDSCDKRQISAPHPKRLRNPFTSRNCRNQLTLFTRFPSYFLPKTWLQKNPLSSAKLQSQCWSLFITCLKPDVWSCCAPAQAQDSLGWWRIDAKSESLRSAPKSHGKVPGEEGFMLVEYGFS